MSRFLRPGDKPAATTRRRSVYDDRPARAREWVQIAEENPGTGRLEWERDWVQRAAGWRPLDDVLRERGGLW